jgi:hypothetical protein
LTCLKKGTLLPFIGKEFLKREVSGGQKFKKSTHKSGTVNAFLEWLKKKMVGTASFWLTESRQQVKIFTLERLTKM